MRRGDFFERELLARALELQAGHRDFTVGLVALSIGRQEDVVLAAVRQQHKLMGHAAAHHAGVGKDGDDVLHADAAEDAFVGGMGLLIIGVQVLLRGMETVGVLHRELADADQAGARTRLVAVFRLDLVDHHWQLLVAVDFRAGDLAAGLLMRHSQDHRLVVTVGEPEQFRADGLVSAGFHPEIGRKHDRHQDFLAADAIHFLADNGLDLGDDALADGKQGVDAGGNGADIAAANQELVARCGGVCRILFQAAPEQLGHFHGKNLADDVI